MNTGLALANNNLLGNVRCDIAFLSCPVITWIHPLWILYREDIERQNGTTGSS